MKQLDTKYDLENTMCCAIAEWFETGHVPLYKYPEKFHYAIWSNKEKGHYSILHIEENISV